MANNFKRKWLIFIALPGAIVAVLAIVFVLFFINRTEVLPPRPPMPTAASSPNIPPPLRQVKLFFFQPESLGLVDISQELRLSHGKIERLKQIINALLDGAPPTLINTIPKGTLLYEVYLDDQSTAYLDFSGALSAAHIGGTTAELLTIRTILKTVQANFGEDIKSVQILIEGQEVDTIAGHVDISKPLSLTTNRQAMREPSNDGTL